MLSFALVLCIEKIVTDHHHHHEEERKIRKTILATINRDYSEHYHEPDNESHPGHDHDHDHEEKDHHHHHKKNLVHASNLLENPENATQLTQPLAGKRDEDDEDEEAFKQVTRTANRIAKKMSFVQSVKKSVALDRN